MHCGIIHKTASHDMLEKYVGRSFPGHIRIEKNKNEFSTNCSVDLWSGLSLHSQGTSDNAHTSVDMALERLDKRLRRYKSRLRDHHNNHKNAAAVLAATDYLVEHAGVDETKFKRPQSGYYRGKTNDYS